MTKLIYRAPRKPQWWWLALSPHSVVERDGQKWELVTVFGNKKWLMASD